MALKAVEGRIVISVDMEYKNSYRFANGTVIRLERKIDSFDQRYTQPINGIVIDGSDIPEGSQILIHHNSTHEVNRIVNYKQVSGADIASDIRYFSIPENEAFAWHDGQEWQPTKGFDFGLRVFKPYKGFMVGIEPTLIKEVLFMTTGEYKNKAVHTLKASDYEIIYQGMDGKEKRLIRCRPFGNKKDGRMPEVSAINEPMTKKILNGEYLIGLSPSTAKPYEKCAAQADR